MIVDAKIDYRAKRLILIQDQGLPDTLPAKRPYFYAIVPNCYKGLFLKLVETLQDKYAVEVEEDNKTPIVYTGTKYEPSNNFTVFRIIAVSPTQIPKISQAIMKLYKKLNIRKAADNVRYIVRNVVDYNIRFFDSIPAHYGFDTRVIHKIRQLKMLLLDVEVIESEPKLVSCYIYTPFEEFRKDDVISLKLPEQLDELQKLINRYSIITGFNLLGFDIPWLKRAGIRIDLTTKCVFDIALILNTYGAGFQVGSARSLLDVALVMKNEVGISDEEIELKRKGRKILKSQNWDEIVKYNINDIGLTVKIEDPFFAFAACTSAITQIPLSEIQVLSSGMVAEYFLLTFCERNGFVPEYRPTEVELKGERVWIIGEKRTFKNVLQVDVKTMYPAFVSYFKIDPTLVTEIGQKISKFDRKNGLGIVYSAVQLFIQYRKYTKQLAKQDKKFKFMDHAVKTILNALAYGVQGKKSGSAIMGNPYCPATIFYGTREAQFKTIDYLSTIGMSYKEDLLFKVIYSDTDSFFIAFNRKPTEDEIKDVVNKINEFLKQYGLEVDIEDVWDEMYIYSKKNYILKKGEKIVIKGSALKMLAKSRLPSCIDIIELLRLPSREDKIKYIQEQIMNCEIHELFIRTHMQIWRTIAKDIQSVKRDKKGQSKYIKVLTPWSEKPTVYLKKLTASQKHSVNNACLIKLLIDGNGIFELENYTAFDIVETFVLKTDDIGLKALPYELLIFDEKLYGVTLHDAKYVIVDGSEIKEIPAAYSPDMVKSRRPEIVQVKAKIQLKKLDIDEDTLRQAVLRYTIKKLEEYELI